MIEPNHAQISVRRQCTLLDLNRSSYYKALQTPATESALNLELMRCIDEQYLKTPFYGWPRMTAQLQRLGYEVNHKRVQRLMQVMGLQALYPKRRTSVADPEHRKYPYLLRNLEIVRCDQVWSTDISPMYQWLRASCTWWRSWIGIAAMCWPGNSRIRWTACSVR